MSIALQKIELLQSKDLNAIDVVCMGHFNVLHPGHFRFLNFAASKGRELCVILKGDDELSEVERQHFFTEVERANSLANIKAVKLIVTRGERTLTETLKILNPKAFVLGHEFLNKRDSTLNEAIEFAKALGVEIIYHSGDRNLNYSGTTAVNKVEPSLRSVAHQTFLRICTKRGIRHEKLKSVIGRFSQLNTLVIGDLIVDEFITTEPLGLSSEAPVVVVKEIEAQRFVGGAGVVAAHVASLGANCHFLSVAGADTPRDIALDQLSKYNVNSNIIVDHNRPTTFKTRYIAGKQKLFRVSRLLDTDIDSEIENRIIEHIEEIAPGLDNIIVSDFVYGVVTDRVLSKIVEVSRKYNVRLFGDLQCSSQVGNVLKFQEFELFFPTEKEARIAIENKNDGLEFVAQSLFQRSKCGKLVIKLGADGLIAYERMADGFITSEHFPALSMNAMDVSGAGDSLLAAMASSLSVDCSFMDACALGSVMASCAVEIMGNIPIDRNTLLDRLESTWN